MVITRSYVHLKCCYGVLSDGLLLVVLIATVAKIMLHRISLTN